MFIPKNTDHMTNFKKVANEENIDDIFNIMSGEIVPDATEENLKNIPKGTESFNIAKPIKDKYIFDNYDKPYLSDETKDIKKINIHRIVNHSQVVHYKY